MKLLRLVSQLIIVAGYLAVSASACAAESLATNAIAHDHEHAASALPSGNVASVSCRSGAFVEAAAILNSTMEIAAALPADLNRKSNGGVGGAVSRAALHEDARQARIHSEIDILLYTALKQAHDEAQCVQGILSHGYDRSFREIIARATTLVRTRGLKADVIDLGEATLSILDAATRSNDASQ